MLNAPINASEIKLHSGIIALHLKSKSLGVVTTDDILVSDTTHNNMLQLQQVGEVEVYSEPISRADADRKIRHLYMFNY